MLTLLRTEAAQRKVLLLAPSSDRVTWDALTDGSFGKDTASMQHAMATLFDHFAVDRDRITVVGFADGVSYALGLGPANGDLFTRILAYSPGYIPPGHRDGRPIIFISHGRRDTILPLTNTSHRQPDQLKQLKQLKQGTAPEGRTGRSVSQATADLIRGEHGCCRAVVVVAQPLGPTRAIADRSRWPLTLSNPGDRWVATLPI